MRDVINEPLESEDILGIYRDLMIELRSKKPNVYNNAETYSNALTAACVLGLRDGGDRHFYIDWIRLYDVIHDENDARSLAAKKSKAVAIAERAAAKSGKMRYLKETDHA